MLQQMPFHRAEDLCEEWREKAVRPKRRQSTSMTKNDKCIEATGSKNECCYCNRNREESIQSKGSFISILLVEGRRVHSLSTQL